MPPYNNALGEEMRKTHEVSHDTLKDALADVVLHSAVSPKAQADELGEGLSTIYRWADVNQPEAYPPITKVIPLARATGNLSLVRFFARRVDAVVVELKDLRPGRSGQLKKDSVAAHMCAMHEEMGKVANLLMLAFKADGFTERDARRCRKDCEDLIDHTATLMKYLEHIEESHQ